jgi:histidyl-tRNA synthetase
MVTPKIQTLPGFRDFLPAEARKRVWLTERLRNIFEIWGYDPLETPTLEPLELFKGKIGEEEPLFFSFTDRGGRAVALRYDQTVPTCRLVGEYAQRLPMPFRRYQIQPTFRAEKPQKGRYREFIQCDADIFGTESPLADAEVIALSLDIYRRLGFKKVRALINDRTLLKDLPYQAVVAIDKIKKIGTDGAIDEMRAKGIDEKKARSYLEYIRGLTPNSTIEIIMKFLTSMGFDKSWFEFDPTTARSFAYSTGPIWEVDIPGYLGGSVLGGERYDRLVEKITGVAIPGTGFGLGFDRTLEAADQFGLLPKTRTSTKVLVTIFAPQTTDIAATITKNLREADINTELYPDADAKLDKQLRYADKRGIPLVVIVGPDEIAKRVVVIKDLRSKSQYTVAQETLTKAIQAVPDEK